MRNAQGFAEWRVDVTGLHCPAPVIRCRAALARMAVGDVLSLSATDRDARREIECLVARQGHQLVALQKHAELVEFTIRKLARRDCAARIRPVTNRRPLLWERLINSILVPAY